MTWKDVLADRMPADLAAEIDTYENQITLKKQGKLDDKLFAETRLRRGVYGQRYDSGQRHDGIAERTLPYPSATLTKGLDTLWDAPGMQRIKIPFGGLSTEQMEVLADVAEEYSDGVLHVTTRQDFQLHYVHIDDTPSLMRRLAAVGITTREACGNTVRNVTGCPLAGVCRDETFDVTPYARACMRFLLGHPDTQDFGRKFKIAFSGCRDHACALVSMHDLGAIAVTRTDNGVDRRGFEVYVGGGLGAVPYQAKLLERFVPEEELLPLAQAIARVFARLGEKKNRQRARIKFLVAQLGVDEFRRLVLEERAKLPPDERWTAHIPDAPFYAEQPGAPSASSPAAAALLPVAASPGATRDKTGQAARAARTDTGNTGVPPASATGGPPPEGLRTDPFDEWCRTNVYHQRQPGYVVATVTLPLGDLTSGQMRQLADLARRHAGGHVRTTVEQNLVLRWVPSADLLAVYQALARIGLAQPGAGTIVDITACPGTDTCKLGIASSRGLAAELQTRLAAKALELDRAVRGLHIKISGCFNSCGQHHVADIGFYGVSRNVGNYNVPHFQLLLGGRWEENAAAYGLAIAAIPAKNIPDVVERLADRFVRDRQNGETFEAFTRRVGKRALKELLDDLAKVPSHDEQPDYYHDWGDPREFTIGDMGVGECAGEVVSLGEFDLAAAEAQVFEAQIQLDDGAYQRADALAYEAMLLAARSLVKRERMEVSEDPDEIVREFRTRFSDTQLFYDKYAGGKFAQYLFRRHETPPVASSRETARRIVEEAQLFLEATHACRARLAARPAAAPAGR